MGLLRAWVKLGRARYRLLICRWFGHRWNEGRPAPKGMCYCDRCQQRYHQ